MQNNPSKPFFYTSLNPVLLMLIAQSGINRLSYTNAIKHKAHEYYALIYHLGLSTDDMTKEEYFDETAQLFRSRATNSHRIKKRYY
jgi:hypothetical protein